MTKEPKNAPSATARRTAMTRLAAFFLLVGALWFSYWFLFLRNVESTDDAYVAGNQVRVAPQISGTVREILTDDTQVVSAGQVLVRLDATDASLALERARADLAETVREISSMMAKRSRLEAVITERERELSRARDDYARRLKPKSPMAVSEEDLAHARDATIIAEAALNAARHELESTHRILRDTPLPEQPQVRQSAYRLREAWLTLQRCEIRSPASGQVARRSAQVGAQVTPGTPLMAVIPLSEIWVDANFKEGQLERMRPGQKVRVHADMYRGRIAHNGTLVGLAAGTGSVFSLLPPENASGNWIKVVQRVPVRIALSPKELAAAPLLLGLSCTVEVDVRDESDIQPITRPSSAQALFSTTALDQDLSLINREIAAIITDNATDAAPADAPDGR